MATPMQQNLALMNQLGATPRRGHRVPELSFPELAVLNNQVALLENLNRSIRRQEEELTPLGSWWDRAVQDPFTQFGAQLMVGGDPMGTGLGGMGAALMMSRQQAMQRRQDRDAAELMVMQIQARAQAQAQKIAAQQQQAQQIQDFIETLPPEQRAAARANPQEFLKQFAQSQYREQKTSTPQRIFQEMGGQEGTGMTFPEWYGSEYKTGTTTNVNVRPAEMKEPIRKRLLEYGAIEQNIDRLDELLKEHGTEVIPSDSKSRMRTVYKALTIGAKNLFQLGALSGADYDLITDTLSDPTAPQAAAIPASRYRVQLDEIRRILSGNRARLAETLPEGERAGVLGTEAGSTGGQWNQTGSGARWRVRQ